MKLQSIFVSYLLLPIISLILVIGTLLLNKKNSIIDNKRLLIFILISILILTLPSLLTFTGIEFVPAYYNLTQIIFLFVGYYYSLKIDSYFRDDNEWRNKGMALLVTTLILCFGSYLFSLVFNYFGDLEYGLMASTCTYTVLIPIFFNWTYKSLLQIPSEIFKIWTYDTLYQETLFNSESIDKIIVIELELSKQIQDKDLVKVKAKAPLNFSFGEWFQMFIHDHNVKYAEGPIQYKDTNGSMHEWIFYTKPTLIKSKKYIDFEKTIEENQLTNDQITVVCKRVSIIQSHSKK